MVSRNSWDFERENVIYAKYAGLYENMKFMSLYLPEYDCKVFVQKDRLYVLEDCSEGYEPAMQSS